MPKESAMANVKLTTMDELHLPLQGVAKAVTQLPQTRCKWESLLLKVILHIS